VRSNIPPSHGVKLPPSIPSTEPVPSQLSVQSKSCIGDRSLKHSKSSGGGVFVNSGLSSSSNLTSIHSMSQQSSGQLKSSILSPISCAGDKSIA